MQWCWCNLQWQSRNGDVRKLLFKVSKLKVKNFFLLTHFATALTPVGLHRSVPTPRLGEGHQDLTTLGTSGWPDIHLMAFLARVNPPYWWLCTVSNWVWVRVPWVDSKQGFAQGPRKPNARTVLGIYKPWFSQELSAAYFVWLTCFAN